MELLPALGIHWLIQMLFVDVKVVALTAPANRTFMVLLKGVLTHLGRQASDSRFIWTNQSFVYPCNLTFYYLPQVTSFTAPV